MGTGENETVQSQTSVEAWRFKLKSLTNRRDEILQLFSRANPKKPTAERGYLDKKYVKELNQELAAINAEIGKCKVQLGEPKHSNPLCSGIKKPTERDPAAFRKDEPLPPKGTWIHIWRG